MTPIQLARFWSRVAVKDRVSCWPWEGPCSDFGYGIAGIDGETKAHRLAYAAINGAVPDDLIVRHKCDNPPCCNPDHLELGTYLDNNRDRKERGRNGYCKGASNASAKLTEDQVREIRVNADGLFQRELAAKYGVTQGLVSKILLRAAWKHID